VQVLDRVVDGMELVSEREIARAVGRYAAAGMRVEGAAAAALAALPRLSKFPGALVLVVTGRNIDEDLYRRAVERPESFPD
jgi:threonine dehydratase